MYYDQSPDIMPINGNRTFINIIKRINNLTIVVLPAPVGPTIATFCPGFIKAENLYNRIIRIITKMYI